MKKGKHRLLLAGFGAALASAGFAASAQESGNSSGAIIGPPQLKDFSLEPRERLVAPPPRPEAQPQPPQQQPQPQPQRQAAPAQTAPQPAPRSDARPEAESAAPAPASVPRPGRSTLTPQAPDPVAGPIFAPPPDLPEEAAPPPPPETAPAQSPSYWLYALPLAALALLGLVVARRRRLAAAGPLDEPAPLVAAPRPPLAPRPDPVPRPWLELSLKAERASFTATEAEVLFELEIANRGGSPARNLRIDVKMFNAGAEQDREIGAFFKTAGRESTKLNLPVVEAGVVGVIHGTVRMPVEEMRAMRLDERLLFIPVVAVNGLYDWGEGRTGQTSCSYVIGRELQQPSEKMGAFRVDQGPRVWRTVGQREHKLKKRV